MLRVRGRDFDVDKFLKKSPWRHQADIHYRGEPLTSRFAQRRLRRKSYPDSGFQIEVTPEGPDGHIRVQVRQVIRFLKKYAKELRRLQKIRTVESKSLDFGVIWEKEVVCKFHHIPAELTKRSGELGIDLMISDYGWCDFEKRRRT